MRRRYPRSADRERGAVLFLVALCLVPLLIIAAIVVDLGQMRATRRSSQSSADLAALAAGYYLSGHGSSSAVADPRAACTAAVNSLRANIGDLPSAMALDCTLFPTTVTSCTVASQTIAATGASPYQISIQWPVPNSALSDSRFNGGTGANDGTSACERMKVTVRRTNAAIFAGMLGISSSNAGASSVVRGSTSVTGSGVAALLLLERVGCGVLYTSGGGSQGAGVVVQSAGASNPGVIQADSAGVVGASVSASGPVSCTTNENASGYVVYGTALPAAGGGGPSITAQNSSDGTVGIIGIRALATGGRGGAVAGTGISPAAISGGVMSRTPADTKYNTPVASGGNAQITTLHATAYARTVGAAPAGYRVLSGSACSGLKTASTPVTEQFVYVNCADFQPDTAVFPNATDVIFTGKVSVANNDLLSLPNAQRIDIRGCTSGCSGGNDYAVSIAGELRVNTGGTGLTSPACSTRAGPGAGGTTTNWARIATFGSKFAVTGSVRLCQTALYLGENQSTYTRRAQTATNTSPENYPAIAGCTASLPCPSDDGGRANIDMTGGSANADWTAPNQLATQPTVAQLATYPFEDLALWSESSEPSSVKGQGSNRTEGVFLTPNSSMTFSGQGTQSVPLNAQFISRTLNISGQGTLNLKPNPADAITVPIAGNLSLIR